MMLNLNKEWNEKYGDTLKDVKSYDPQLVSNQLQSLVGKNVQHFFSCTNEVLVKWNGKWVEFNVYNSVFNIL